MEYVVFVLRLGTAYAVFHFNSLVWPSKFPFKRSNSGLSESHNMILFYVLRVAVPLPAANVLSLNRNVAPFLTYTASVSPSFQTSVLT